jgi:tRNA(fMet)-specific endonuclease VapC
VTAAELYFGAASSIAPESNAEVVGRFLATLPVLGLDDQAARRFGQTKARLRREGAAVPDADLLIAAVAVAQGAVLVTGNRRHYERIPEVRVEDWIR